MKIGLFIALVVVIHHATSIRLGCGCGSCHGINLGHGHGHGHVRPSCGCGFPFPSRQRCEGADLIQSDDWCSSGPGGSGQDTVPLVVRPHELPKPVLSPQTENDLNQPVAGPCAVKKAIVKPAVLPKPVCRDHGHHEVIGHSSHSSHSSCSHDEHSCFSHGHGHHGHHGHLHGIHGLHGLHGPHGLHGIPHGAVFGPNRVLRPGEVGPNGETVGPNGLIVGPDGQIIGPNGPFGGPNGPFVPGALRPADAVSIDLALKLAQQNDIVRSESEDRLNFGFRKIPEELPARRVVQNNVPEEQIFNLNGQIVELTPVNPTRQNPLTLAEEAAEQLRQLQEDEAEALAEDGAVGGPFGPGPRRPSLGEIGFCAARPPTPNLVDVPASAGHGHHGHISTNCGCGHFVGSHHGSCHSHASCDCNEKCCRIIPGNVEYKTVPKPQQICLPVPEQPDSCESQEVELSQEDTKIHCSCIPVCRKTSTRNCRKSCINFEKINC